MVSEVQREVYSVGFKLTLQQAMSFHFAMQDVIAVFTYTSTNQLSDLPAKKDKDGYTDGNGYTAMTMEVANENDNDNDTRPKKYDGNGYTTMTMTMEVAMTMAMAIAMIREVAMETDVQQ